MDRTDYAPNRPWHRTQNPGGFSVHAPGESLLAWTQAHDSPMTWPPHRAGELAGWNARDIFHLVPGGESSGGIPFWFPTSDGVQRRTSHEFAVPLFQPQLETHLHGNWYPGSQREYDSRLFELSRHMMRPMNPLELLRSGVVEPPPGANNDPDDWMSRLVFADWLDEHADEYPFPEMSWDGRPILDKETGLWVPARDNWDGELTLGNFERTVAERIRHRLENPAPPLPLDPRDTDADGNPYQYTADQQSAYDSYWAEGWHDPAPPTADSWWVDHNETGRAVNYGFPEDNAAFADAIRAQPLDWQTHGIWADFLQDHDDSDAPFRREVSESIKRRLETPWAAPRTVIPPGASTSYLIQPHSHGPLDPYIQILRDGDRTYTPEPGMFRGDTFWRWLLHGPNDKGTQIGPIPDGFDLNQWVHSHQLSQVLPAERWFAGIENPANLDPAIWPQIEAIMRGQHDRGQRLSSDNSPTAYGTADDERAFLHKIRTNPLDVTDHLVFADWLRDQDRTADADFRSQLGQWVQERLNWSPPLADVTGGFLDDGRVTDHDVYDLPVFDFDTTAGRLLRPPYVLDHLYPQSWDALNQNDDIPSNQWEWHWASEPVNPLRTSNRNLLLNHLRLPADSLDSHVDEFRRFSHWLRPLSEAERLVAGINDMGDVDWRDFASGPLWDHISGLLRRRFDGGQRLSSDDQPTEYAHPFMNPQGNWRRPDQDDGDPYLHDDGRLVELHGPSTAGDYYVYPIDNPLGIEGEAIGQFASNKRARRWLESQGFRPFSWNDPAAPTEYGQLTPYADPFKDPAGQWISPYTGGHEYAHPDGWVAVIRRFDDIDGPFYQVDVDVDGDWQQPEFQSHIEAQEWLAQRGFAPSALPQVVDDEPTDYAEPTFTPTKRTKSPGWVYTPPTPTPEAGTREAGTWDDLSWADPVSPVDSDAPADLPWANEWVEPPADAHVVDYPSTASIRDDDPHQQEHQPTTPEFWTHLLQHGLRPNTPAWAAAMQTVQQRAGTGPTQASRYSATVTPYGEDEDYDAFMTSIFNEPREVTNHLVFADWLGDQSGRETDELFRRHLAQVLSTRLSTPFPDDTRSERTGFTNGIMTSAPRGFSPSNIPTHQPWSANPNGSWSVHTFRPAIVDLYNPDASPWAWSLWGNTWMGHHPPERGEGPYPNYGDWLSARRGPGEAGTDLGARLLTEPEEGAYDITSLENVDPHYWPAIEALLRSQWNKHQQFASDDQPTAYGQAEEDAAFRHSISGQPTDLTNHGVYADWLQDEHGESHPDVLFRRGLMDLIGSRSDPHDPRDLVEGWNRRMTQPPRGLSSVPEIPTWDEAADVFGSNDTYWQHQIRRPAVSRSTWRWAPQFAGEYSYPREFNNPWYVNREQIGRILGISPEEVMSHNSEQWLHDRNPDGEYDNRLTPVEMGAYDITPLSQIDPAIWPQVEALLRQRWDKGGQKFSRYQRTDYADPHTIQELLRQLQSPEQAAHRQGQDDPLSGLRGILADAYDDPDHPEAQLLRTPNRHVIVRPDGTIAPGRWGFEHIGAALLTDHYREVGNDDEAAYWQSIWQNAPDAADPRTHPVHGVGTVGQGTRWLNWFEEEDPDYTAVQRPTEYDDPYDMSGDWPVGNLEYEVGGSSTQYSHHRNPMLDNLGFQEFHGRAHGRAPFSIPAQNWGYVLKPAQIPNENAALWAVMGEGQPHVLSSTTEWNQGRDIHAPWADFWADVPHNSWLGNWHHELDNKFLQPLFPHEFWRSGLVDPAPGALAHPDDWQSRLVFADWLAEDNHGDFFTPESQRQFSNRFYLETPEELMRKTAENIQKRLAKGHYLPPFPPPPSGLGSHDDPEVQKRAQRERFGYSRTDYNDEATFQRMLDENPDDHMTRLVFADWLDEQGDPRGPGYRALGRNRHVPDFNDPVYPPWFWNAHLATEGAPLIPSEIPRDWWDAFYRQARGRNLPTTPQNRAQLEDMAARAFAQLPPERQAELLAAVGYADDTGPTPYYDLPPRMVESTPIMDSAPPVSRRRRKRGMQYGLKDDIRGFQHEISRRPLELTHHGAFADWLEEQGHPDAQFRRQVHAWLTDSLITNPWTPPETNGYGQLLQWGDGYQLPAIEPSEGAPHEIGARYAPFASRSDNWVWRNDPRFDRVPATTPERLAHILGSRQRREGRDLEFDRWVRAAEINGDPDEGAWMSALTGPERAFAHIDDLGAMDPADWPGVEAIMRERLGRLGRFGRDGTQINYGDAEDEAAFIRSINEEPLDVLRHGALADWYGDRGRDEEGYRRAVAESLQRRLGHQWQPPRRNQLGFLHQEFGPLDHYVQQVWSSWPHTLGSTVTMVPATLEDTGFGALDWTSRLGHPYHGFPEVGTDWTWDVASAKHGPNHDGLPSMGDWWAERSRDFVNHNPQVVREPHPNVLTQAERWFAGIENPANLDPAIWPQIEAIMQNFHDRGQRLAEGTAPIKYGTDDEIAAVEAQLSLRDMQVAEELQRKHDEVQQVLEASLSEGLSPDDPAIQFAMKTLKETQRLIADRKASAASRRVQYSVREPRTCWVTPEEAEWHDMGEPARYSDPEDVYNHIFTDPLDPLAHRVYADRLQDDLGEDHPDVLFRRQVGDWAERGLNWERPQTDAHGFFVHHSGDPFQIPVIDIDSGYTPRRYYPELLRPRHRPSQEWEWRTYSGPSHLIGTYTDSAEHAASLLGLRSDDPEYDAKMQQLLSDNVRWRSLLTVPEQIASGIEDPRTFVLNDPNLNLWERVEALLRQRYDQGLRLGSDDRPTNYSGGPYTREDFLERIHAEPEETTNALVFADWLDEQGESALAQVVRAHVEHTGRGVDLTGGPEAWSGQRMLHGGSRGSGMNPPWQVDAFAYLPPEVTHPGELPVSGARGLRWVGLYPDQASADPVARGLLESGHIPHGGSYWQNGYDGLHGMYTPVQDRIFDQAASARHANYSGSATNYAPNPNLDQAGNYFPLDDEARRQYEELRDLGYSDWAARANSEYWDDFDAGMSAGDSDYENARRLNPPGTVYSHYPQQPTLYPPISAFRDPTQYDPEPTGYGQAEDIAEFHRQLRANPLDLTTHGVFADYLTDVDHPDQEFRRRVRDAMNRRLTANWHEPRTDRRGFLHQEFGPEDDYVERFQSPGIHTRHNLRLMIPALGNPNPSASSGLWSMHAMVDGRFPDDNQWAWDVHDNEYDLKPDDPQLRDPSTTLSVGSLNEWRHRREMGRSPGVPLWHSTLAGHPHALSPAELWFAGIHNPANMQPDLWPQVEALMRHQHNRGVRLGNDAVPTEYEDATQSGDYSSGDRDYWRTKPQNYAWFHDETTAGPRPDDAPLNQQGLGFTHAPWTDPEFWANLSQSVWGGFDPDVDDDHQQLPGEMIPVQYGQAEDLAAFLSTIRQQPHEDTNWLALADWLQDEGLHPQSPDRIRWWMGARNHMRPRRMWNGDVTPPESRLAQLGPDWVARLFGVENARHLFDRYWPLPLHPQIRGVVNDTHHISELFGFGLATDEQRRAAESAARNAAWNEDEDAVGNASWSEDEDAARSAAWSAAWNADENVVGVRAWDAAWSAIGSAAQNAAWSAAQNAAWSAAWNAAENSARNAARNAFTSSHDALDEFVRDNPVPNSRQPVGYAEYYTPHDQYLVKYGLAEDEAEFVRSINEEPLDLINHGVYADWLGDHDRTQDEAFRRALIERIDHTRRTPFAPPAVDGAGWWRSAAHGPLGPEIPVVRVMEPRADNRGRLIDRLNPVLSNGDWNLNQLPEGTWSWEQAGSMFNDKWIVRSQADHPDNLEYLRRLMRLGPREDPRDFELQRWLRSREPEHPGVEWGYDHASILTPEERYWVGVDDWSGIDPAIWPHIEALLRREHERGNVF